MQTSFSVPNAISKQNAVKHKFKSIQYSLLLMYRGTKLLELNTKIVWESHNY